MRHITQELIYYELNDTWHELFSLYNWEQVDLVYKIFCNSNEISTKDVGTMNDSRRIIKLLKEEIERLKRNMIGDIVNNVKDHNDYNRNI